MLIEWLSKEKIYLDFPATTPLDFRVLDGVLPFLTSAHGNTYSRTHEYGWLTEKAVEDTREKVDKLINANFKKILLLGATESNNLALKG